jgi:CheY-like chemotaxis protein/anti-sigma regulatory factor (Ser/Thr protein kinase)
MNGILGFANLLKNESISDADRKQYITIIEQSGKRMLNIINDLIDISKIESGMTEAVISDFNLNNSLEYVYSFFKPEAEAKGLELSYSTELENTAALIKSDREKVYAVLINLVKNAIKYTHKGKIHFSYHIKNSKLTVVVKDTGIGIPQDKLETVFNRFVQADSNLSNTTQEGVGLGLAITKAFTKLLKGKIWVESEYEKGSTFYFEIPYIKGEDLTQTDETDNIMTDNKPNKKLKILVAEDDAINRKLFSYTLKDIAEELILVPNGAEAVKTTQERKDIDLVLMDLKMPVMDGYEATLKIREEDKEIVIIALSAFAMDSERKKAMELGFNSYVSKPISKNDLIKAVREYFDL